MKSPAPRRPATPGEPDPIKCSLCGRCCLTNNIPMTEDEQTLIEQYVSQRRVTVGRGPQCRYLQRNGRCGIYIVRPKICRDALCPRGRVSSDDRMIMRGETPPTWHPKEATPVEIKPVISLADLRKQTTG